MTSSMRRILLAACLALVAGSARAEPPLWVVRDADSEMVIFGSVHLLPPGLVWQPEPLTAAQQVADDLWFELAMGETVEREISRLATAKGVLAPGHSPFDQLPAGNADRLARIARAYGIDPVTLAPLEPWLAGAVYRRAGAGTENGAEKSLALAAPKSVARRALETPAERVRHFDATPLAEQIVSLRETITQLETDSRAFETLVRMAGGGRGGSGP